MSKTYSILVEAMVDILVEANSEEEAVASITSRIKDSGYIGDDPIYDATVFAILSDEFDVAECDEDGNVEDQTPKSRLTLIKPEDEKKH